MPSTVRALLAPFLAVIVLTALFTPVFAQAAGRADPNAANAATGTIELSGGGVALGVGVSWGKGTLTYRGQTYKLKTNGLSAVDIGASGYTANGTVENLKKLSDIEGNYTAGQLGATVAGGGGVTTMKNDKGVVIKMHATSRGLQFTAAPKGVKVELAK